MLTYYILSNNLQLARKSHNRIVSLEINIVDAKNLGTDLRFSPAPVPSAQPGMIQIRVDDEIKAQASQTLEAMGLSVSEAVRLFLYRVVTDQALPFDVKVPNAKTRAAMTEAEAIARSHRARFETSEEMKGHLALSGKTMS